MGFTGGLVVKNPPINARDASSIPGLGRAPGEGNGNPFSSLAWEVLWTRSLAGYSPGGPQESDTEQLNKKSFSKA